MYAKVKDRRTGVLKTVMAKAYQLIPHRYDLLGYIDEDGNPVDGPTQTPFVVKKSPARAVAPAATKAKLTREDLERMNAEAMDRAKKNKAELDSLRVPEGFGLTPTTGPDHELTVDHVGLKEEDVNVLHAEFSKRVLDEVDKQIAAIPPRPSATKVKSVKTFKK